MLNLDVALISSVGDRQTAVLGMELPGSGEGEKAVRIYSIINGFHLMD
jgi:hypothetical protein